MGLTVFCSKSPAWTKRPSAGGAWSWLLLWWTARSTGYGRRVLAGRRQKKDLTLVATVQELVEPETAGDPMTGQIWVRSSLRSIRDRLVAVGHSVSPPTVGRLLKDLGYSLHVNSKKIEASSNHPDRDQQFAYIAVQRATFTAAGLPILSTDTKKKLRHEVARSEWTRR
jgi:hypothetical protein